jgi:hypothetical protein
VELEWLGWVSWGVWYSVVLDVGGDGGMRLRGRRDFGASPGQVDLARCYGGREMRILTFSGRRGSGHEEHRWKMANDKN